MKILSIQILASPKTAGQPAIVLAAASDVSSFSFFQRGSIDEVRRRVYARSLAAAHTFFAGSS